MSEQMMEQKMVRKSNPLLIVLLCVALIAAIALGVMYFQTDQQLAQTSEELTQMTAQQETTAATLAETESKLADTQTSLADMTTLQETTAATLADTEGKLADAQTALTDMTTLQETTAATLAETEGKLTEAQTALTDMTTLQETTAATLAETEVALADAQTALSDMTTLQETTAATLAETESELADTQFSLGYMTTLQEATAAALLNTEGWLAEAQTALADMMTLQETTAATLAETETKLAEAQAAALAENARLQVGAQGEAAAVGKDPDHGDDFEVVKKYEWNDYGSHNLALVVRNTSEVDKDFSMYVAYYDENGCLTGTSSALFEPCESGKEVFLSDEYYGPYAYYEYAIQTEDTTADAILNSAIDITATVQPEGLMLEVKNNGAITPDWAYIWCVFFDENGKVITGDGFFASEPDPGQTCYEQSNIYEEFASYEVYYSVYTY